MSQLYLVATPIGNLGDFSPRAVETLQAVDFILAEDTRVTRKLCTRFAITTPTYSYHKHNEHPQAEAISARILAGASCAIVSDAGTPCISDPGEILVKQCVAKNIPVTVIPGANAAISALAISGISTSRFTFEGFLSTNKKNRTEHLASLEQERRTMIFYEAPHKLERTLSDFAITFGQARPIAVVRELTKLYEEVRRTTVENAINYYSTQKPRGEFVLIVAGFVKEEAYEVTLEDAIVMAQEHLKEGAKLTDVAKQVAKITPFSKAQLYQELMKLVE